MKAIVVPTDFSDAAKNAAVYAIAMAKQLGVSKIVLFHSYQYLNASDPLNGYEQVVMSDKAKSDELLPALVSELKTLAEDVELYAYHSGETLETGIENMCKMADADLVVMGMKGWRKTKRSFYWKQHTKSCSTYKVAGNNRSCNSNFYKN